MSTKLALTSGGAAGIAPEDVFATWLYTGNATARNIQNGINLATHGGMVWTKNRGRSSPHRLCDTARGVNSMLSTSTGNGSGSTTFANSLTAFNSDGYSLGTDSANAEVNLSSWDYNSWTFRRAPRFFDVVTYTGTGAAQNIPHSLGVAPGFIMVKRTDANTDPFYAYHISLGAGNFIDINQDVGSTASTTIWNNAVATPSVFSVGVDARSNASGGTFVAYVFAHDAATNGIIQCGSYAGNSSSSGPTLTLGWEPQWLLVRPSGSGPTYQGTISDSLREMSFSRLFVHYPGGTNQETELSPQIGLSPTGFRLINAANAFNATGQTYYYVAIRRPIKRPTSATQVFSPHTYTGTGAAQTITSPGFPVDLFIGRPTAGANIGAVDRVRGPTRGVYTNAGTTEWSTNLTDMTSFTSLLGYSLAANQEASFNGSSTSQLGYAFKRSAGFFDIVHYTGTGANRTVSHQLDASPEMMLIRSRGAQSWAVYHSGLGTGQHQTLNGATSATTSSTAWNGTAPSKTQFSLGTDAIVNSNATNYIAYLFASLEGICKVGSYTGNGSSQAINCGFATGARFVIVKRATSTGPATSSYSNGWCVADTARGVISAAEPVFALNSSAGDSSYDWIDPDNSGFVINQETNTDLNVSGVSYIYLAIA